VYVLRCHILYYSEYYCMLIGNWKGGDVHYHHEPPTSHAKSPKMNQDPRAHSMAGSNQLFDLPTPAQRTTLLIAASPAAF
jgi:hypothetical protein